MTKSQKPSGCLGRLFKLLVVSMGLLSLAALGGHIRTQRAIQGSGQFVHAGWSPTTVARLLAASSQDKGQEGATVPPDVAQAATRIGNAVAAKLAHRLTLEITGNGYRVGGATAGARLGTSLLRAVAQGPDQVGGCTSGSFVAAFPLLHATCGDGSGRTLWFLMTSWPGQEMNLLLLPVGTPALRERLTRFASRTSARDAARTAKELLTLHFKRAT